MKYTKSGLPELLGLGKLERRRIAVTQQTSHAVLFTHQAANVLNTSRPKASKQLSVLASKGWVRRIKRGAYVPVPATATSSNIYPEYPFAIAHELYAPCYIGGMNAANYWDLTEQLFRTITVMTQKPQRNRRPTISGIEYALHTIQPKYFFGLAPLWDGTTKAAISDPTRTILDMMIFPQFCGGIAFGTEVLKNYWRSEHKNVDLLIEYLAQAKNGAAIKRLGYLVESLFPDEQKLISYCKKNLTAGNIKLSPDDQCTKLITRWKLWVYDN